MACALCNSDCKKPKLEPKIQPINAYNRCLVACWNLGSSAGSCDIRSCPHNS
jgi:hypothetical protein